MKPPPASLGKFDLIFLRNVLIYFDHDTKKQVVERLLSALKQADIFSSAIRRACTVSADRCSR
ncbi:CheR family methyltransferase [Methylomonas koyamae]|uniref:CheR family methyltransferase n=1 Tax=Methylomonas koyamae TaxID=702114 RepID=UPI003570B186